MPEPRPTEHTEPVEVTTPRLCPLYRVLLHNDDDTDATFVFQLLQEIFAKPLEEAAELVLEAHEGGVALIEIVPREHAEFHVEQAHSRSRAAKFPLTFTIEPESKT